MVGETKQIHVWSDALGWHYKKVKVLSRSKDILGNPSYLCETAYGNRLWATERELEDVEE
jgi:hypothetical protein